MKSKHEHQIVDLSIFNCHSERLKILGVDSKIQFFFKRTDLLLKKSDTNWKGVKNSLKRIAANFSKRSERERDRERERERANFEANLKRICEYQKRKVNLSLHQIFVKLKPLS